MAHKTHRGGQARCAKNRLGAGRRSTPYRVSECDFQRLQVRKWQLVQRNGNDATGFGFITPDEGSEDLFAHISEIKTEGFKSLQENQKVSFNVKMGPKGKQAANIKPV
ncbi:cold-shock DNA-binding domain-containing protein [Paraburkholderia hospita]|uniref:Cold-shock DNA-binding domain-containing protein n=1 Tax=Paraburkholderia hospita TaxID=169430 RepID=A0ABP2PNV8_9BURK|nr:cold-shock DNA-binding domain-containing protein [Paraburkholderia hospita]